MGVVCGDKVPKVAKKQKQAKKEKKDTSPVEVRGALYVLTAAFVKGVICEATRHTLSY